MRIFLSYAWKSKADDASVPELLTFLEDDLRADVWVDNEQMTPGVDLNDHLSAQIEQRDAVLLVLSRHVVGNPNVGFELDTAARLGKPVVACRVDNVKTTGDARLDGMLLVDWNGPGGAREIGKRKLKDFFFSLYRERLAPEDRQTIDDLRKLTASLENLQYRRASAADRGDDRAFATRAVSRAVRLAEGDDSTEAGALRTMAEVLQQLKTAGEDPNLLAAAVTRLGEIEAADPTGFGLAAVRLRQEVEGRLAGLTPPAASRAERKVRAGQAMTGEVDPRDQLRALLAPHLPANLVDAVAGSVLDYVAAAPGVLDTFTQALAGTRHPQLMQVAAALNHYLAEPNDLLPDHLGVLGVLDDAWLIHNTVAPTVAMGLVPSGWGKPVDWNRITQANGVVEALLPPQVKPVLAATCQQLLGAVQGALQPWSGFGMVAYGATQTSFGGGYSQSTEDLRDELAPHVGGLMLKYGV